MTVLQEPTRVKSQAAKQDWSHVRGYGWRPQLPDVRDKLYAARLTGPLPHEYDLRPSMPPVYDQGQLGSCTGNAIAGAMEYERDRQGLPDFVPSRLFIYYNERALEGTVSSDAGADDQGRRSRWSTPRVCARKRCGRTTLGCSR